jgi:FixJ family two-component response regulator/flagellar biosynthesis/type III secretory pathway protein FliH
MSATGDMQVTPAVAHRAASIDSALRTVLIVDDEEPVRGLLAAILGNAGYQITQAGTGREALAKLRERPADLMITDIKLPDVDGITLMKQAFEVNAKLTAVTMTGYGSVDLAVNAMKAGAADFLTKPFLPDMVTLTVKRLADLRRLRQENAVLKHKLVQSGTVRLQNLALADFSNGGRVEGPDGLTDFERGVAEGERRAAQRTSMAREREQAVLSTLAHRLEERWKTLHESVEDDVASLAFSIASRIVRQAGECTKELVLDQVRAALAHVSEGGIVKITVHPADLATVESSRERLSRECDRPVTFVCSTDPNIAPGGCFVQTTSRMIDATLDAQLQRLGEAMQGRISRESR